jgi:hypothetical protein
VYAPFKDGHSFVLLNAREILDELGFVAAIYIDVCASMFQKILDQSCAAISSGAENRIGDSCIHLGTLVL